MDVKTSLQETWTDEAVLNVSSIISSFFLCTKKTLLVDESVPSFFIKDYLEQPCIPEILADSFCDLTNKNHLKKIVAPLEAFQTYAISLYDQIDDNHLVKDNDLTILGRYGFRETFKLKQTCERIYLHLAKRLSFLVPGAERTAQEQYKLTLKADKIRNSQTILSPLEAIALQNILAGIPTEKIALLCDSKESKKLARNIGNSLSTIDDLIDLINTEDLGKIKTTIPISYLFQENPQIFNCSPLQARDYFLKSDSLKRTIEYLDQELDNAGLKLEDLDPKGENILSLYKNKMQKYLRKIENG